MGKMDVDRKKRMSHNISAKVLCMYNLDFLEDFQFKIFCLLILKYTFLDYFFSSF